MYLIEIVFRIISVKNYVIWPCLVVVLIALLSFSCIESEKNVIGTDEGTLIREIMSVRDRDKTAFIDVSNVVIKYIKQGVDAEEVEALLKFHCFDVSKRLYRDVVYVYGVSKREKIYSALVMIYM